LSITTNHASSIGKSCIARSENASCIIALLVGSGDASPAGLMFLGLGLIGLRDRIERGFRGDA